MNYERYKELTINWNKGTILCDEYVSLEYTDILAILEEIDVIFSVHDSRNIRCLYLESQNTVFLSILVFYLLIEKVNFYLFSGSLTVNSEVPPFCDKILTVSSTYSKDVNTLKSIEIIDNRRHTGENSAFVPNSGAVLFSTSGTTGPAKFICFDQNSLLQNSRNLIGRFSLGADSRILIPVPTGHMYGMGVGLLPALLAGASICFIEKNNILKLFDKLKEFKPNVVLLTPTIIKMMVMFTKDIPSKSVYITAGERIDEGLYGHFETNFGSLVNLYGCTELGAIATSSLLDHNPQDRRKGLLWPLAGVKVEIKGDEKGEIFCKHNAGFQKYMDKYGAVVPSLHINKSWHPTRDIGSVSARGSFYVTGRVDNCINRSGFLISLEEIEVTLLNLFKEIEYAVVFDCEDGTKLRTELIAVLELGTGAELAIDFVKKTCGESMSKYLVPDEFHFMDKIPRLSSGKPDRALLIKSYKQKFKTNLKNYE